MSSSIDLHIHSAASDGSDAVPALLDKILSAGLRCFSVTDHDTVEGAVEMQKLVPKTVQYIPGVEFSCVTPSGKCHILGYGFDPEHAALQTVLHTGNQLRRKKLQTRVTFLEKQFGIRLTEEERCWLDSQKSPGKPHLARILVNRGLAPDIGSAIRQSINLCKGGNDRINAELAIRGILHAGGIPVWAHPLGGEGEKRLSEAAYLAQMDTLLACGVAGMECHYSRYNAMETAFLRKHASAHDLLISGGSDFHGTAKPDLRLGMLNTEDAPVNPEELTLWSKCFLL